MYALTLVVSRGRGGSSALLISFYLGEGKHCQKINSIYEVLFSAMRQLKLIYEELRKEILFKTILLIGNKNGSFYNVYLGKILLQVAGKIYVF